MLCDIGITMKSNLECAVDQWSTNLVTDDEVRVESRTGPTHDGDEHGEGGQDEVHVQHQRDQQGAWEQHEHVTITFWEDSKGSYTSNKLLTRLYNQGISKYSMNIITNAQCFVMNTDQYKFNLMQERTRNVRGYQSVRTILNHLQTTFKL